MSGPSVETVGDGSGITIVVEHPRVGQGEIVVRQSAEVGWDGLLGKDGVVRGTMTYLPVQEQLSANRWWLRRPLRVRPAPGSSFELVPAPAGTTCAALP